MVQIAQSIPFEAFASFVRVPEAGPLFSCTPPEWAAAAHAVVVDGTVHYLWARRRVDNSWLLMHSSAPGSSPAAVEHDPRNPVLVPASSEGFDDYAVEYPFPFRNPADDKLYAYYLGRRKGLPKQTGLLVSDGDFGNWARVRSTPVIAVETEFELAHRACPHPRFPQLRGESLQPDFHAFPGSRRLGLRWHPHPPGICRGRAHLYALCRIAGPRMAVGAGSGYRAVTFRWLTRYQPS